MMLCVFGFILVAMRIVSQGYMRGDLVIVTSLTIAKKILVLTSTER